MKRLKSRINLLPVILATMVAEAGVVVYQNDFSTRTSEKPVPSTEWQRSSYVTGTIQRARPSAVGNGRDGVFSSQLGDPQTQDAWLWAYDGNADQESLFYRMENGGAANKSAMFMNTYPTVTDPTKDHRTYFYQAFGNEFKSGILRMSFDLRAFKFTKIQNNNLFVGPIYKKYLDCWWGASLPKYAGFAGINMEQRNGVDNVKAYSYGGNGEGAGSYDGHYVGSKLIQGEWYRYVVDFNADTQEMSGKVYAMGSTQPDLNSTGTWMADLTPVRFYADLTEETGGFAGIVIRDCGSVSSPNNTEVESQRPMIDNLRCWWRESGTDFTDNDLFYENDFVTRRTRTLRPVPQKSVAYDRTEKTATTTLSKYFYYTKFETNTDSMKNRLVSAPSKKKELQSITFDGMRLLNGTSTLSFFTFNIDNNPRMIGMRLMGDGNPFGIFTQHLGEKITSGKVRLSYDVRTPKSWIGSCPWIYGMVAPQTYYDSINDDIQTTAYAYRVGFQGTAKSTTTKFAAIGSATQTAADAKVLTWYRVIGTCDMDGKTFDCEIYEIGANPIAMTQEVTGAPVFAKTGIGLKNQSLTDISCFAFFLGGTPEMTLDGAIHVDNIRIWKQAKAATDWTALYANDFTTRTRYNVKETSCQLTEMSEVMGLDGWTMHVDGLAPIATSGTENPALRCDGNTTGDQSFSWVVQTLGKPIRRGKAKLRVDIKPPRVWTPGFTSNTGVMIGLGDEQMASGNRACGNADLSFLNHYQVRFGIGPEASGGPNKDYEIQKYRTNRPFYFDEKGSRAYTVNASNQKYDLNHTHWYRFEAKADVDNQTYDLSVYDMGTVQPTVTTATSSGTLLFTRENKKFRMPLSDGRGLSALTVCFEGCAKDSPWNELTGGYDDGQAYVDNIVVEHNKPGLAIMMR